MMHYATLLTLSLAALAGAATDGEGTCAEFPDEYTPGSDMASINSIARMGEMAMVSFDPNDAEKELTCIRMTLKKDTFTIKYIEGGEAKEVSGAVTVEEQTYEEETRYYYEMTNDEGFADLGIFGSGKLYPIFDGKKEVILNGCKDGEGGSYSKTAYFLVPLDKAIENSGCNCDDWSSYES